MSVGIVVKSLVEPYILLPQLDARKYLIVLEEVLLEMLNDIPAYFYSGMWFYYDRVPSHYAMSVRGHLNWSFGNN